MRRAARYAGATVVVLGAFVLGFLITQSEPSVGSAAAPLRADRPIRLVDEVRAVLASSYYRWIDPDILRRGSVDTILAGLDDPHTDYLTPAEYLTLQERTHGTYSGIGLTVGPSRDGLVVTSALEGPARKAGIRKGDVILRIDGKPAGDLPFEQSLALIKGEQGTLVHLTVVRPRKGTMEFTVMRQEIPVPPIETRTVTVRKTKLAYIRVFSFPEGAARLLERATTRLVAEGVRGAIIDLRDNPGGLLSEAVAAASIFLESGLVCRTDGLHEEPRSYGVTGVASHPALPLVTLVNAGSASAAEILAAALADHDRALVAGEQTFGKSSVQSIAPLRDGGALKLTTAKYVTPAGADITAVGIEPPVVAADDPLTPPDEALRIARRALVQTVGAS